MRRPTDNPIQVYIIDHVCHQQRDPQKTSVQLSQSNHTVMSAQCVCEGFIVNVNISFCVCVYV